MVYWLVIALNFSLWFVLHLCLVNDDDDDDDDDNDDNNNNNDNNNNVSVPRCSKMLV